MEQKEKNFFSPSILKASIVYIAVVFIISSLFVILFCVLCAKINGVDSNLVIEIITNKAGVDKESNAYSCYLTGYGIGTCFSYFLALCGIALWMRNDFIDDFNTLKAEPKKYGIFIPIASVVFVTLAIGCEHLLSLLPFMKDSNNQSLIVELLTSNAFFPMVISTVLLAPIVEEMIYRKAIFKALSKFSIIPCYVASIVLFTLPHMLSTQSNLGIWLMQCVPYALCGFMLCFIYHKSKFNIYASIAAHMLNNLLAIILVFI